MIKWRSLLPLAAICLLCWSGAEASAQTVSIDYDVSVAGIPAGTAQLQATLEDDRYTIQLSGRLGGMMRVFSDAEASAEARGRRTDAGLLPDGYEHRWSEDGDTETARLRFAEDAVSSIRVKPKPRRPKRRVAVRDSDKAGVLDPLSAFVWLAGGAPTCDRTLPIFEGTHRFDLVLAPGRAERFAARDGSFSGPAIACALRYRPVSGHRRDKAIVGEMAANEDMEVWIAAIVGRLALPVQASVSTRYGRIALQAVHIGVN